MEQTNHLVFLDIETAGLKPNAPIIELAAVAVESGTFRELETFEAKVDFDMKEADVRSLGVTKFSPSEWRYALPATDAAGKLAAFLRAHATKALPSKRRLGGSYSVARIAAYNAGFDASRLRRWSKRVDVYLPMMRMAFCVMQRTLWFFEENQGIVPPEDYKLSTVAQHLNLRNRPTHSALDDVRATVELARMLAEYNRITTTRAA